MNYDQKQQRQKQKMLHKFAHIFAAFLIVLSCLSFAQNVRAQDITSGLVGHWTMDETSGTTLRDNSANGIDGTMQNGLDGTSTVAGIVGTAIDFAGPGSNEIIDIPNNAAYNTDTFTMAFWIKTTQSCGSVSPINCPGIIRKISGNPPSGGASGWFINSARNSGGVAFVWYDGATNGWTSSADINDNEWHHVTVVKTATEIKIYIDGFISRKEPYSNASVINTTDFVIGNGTSSGTNNSFTGALDDIRFYNRALSSSDIQTLVEVSGQTLEIPGYFVLIGNQPTNAEVNEFTGDLGGIAGANQTCMNYLTNYDWLGKDDALQADMITAENVKAWLCDDEGCQDMLPNTEYRFAKTEAGEENTGGANFTTDANGFYPSTDTNTWDGDEYFARNTSFWTGREPNNTNTATTNIDCNNFTSTAFSGIKGNTLETGTGRWSNGTDGCSSTDQFICFVNPAPNHKVCNEAHAGKMIYNDNYRVMQYCDGTEWINMGKESSLLQGQKTSGEDYGMNGVEFDGTNDWLTTTGFGISTPLTTISGSFWINRTASGVGTNQPIIFTEDTPQVAYFRARFNTSNQFVIDGRDNASGSFTTFLNSTNTVVADGWHHVLFSIDVTYNTLQQLYIDDVDVLNSTGNTDPEFGIDIDRVNIGSEAFTGNSRLHGSLADVWVDFGNYIDFSLEENRRIFINPDGLGIDLGTDGSRPTGTAPDIFLSGDAASWHTNKTGGAGFTENGALTNSTTDPPHNYVKKLVGWWKLDETNGTSISDNSGNGNTLTLVGTNAIDASIPGPVNNAIALDGVDDQINGTIGQITNDEITLSLWMKNFEHTANPFKRVVKLGSFWLQLLGNDICITYAGHSTNCTTAFVPEDEWSHILITVNNKTLQGQAYVNGVLLDTVALGEYIPIGTSLSLGEVGSPYGHDAYFDDLRIYNYTLSAAEIGELYNTSSIIYKPNAVEFDGSNDYVIGPATPIGMADGKEGAISVWFKLDDNSTDRRILRNSSSRIIVEFDAGNGGQIRIWGEDSSNTTLINMGSASLNGDTTGWHHFMASWDTSDPTKRHVYLDGVSSLDTSSYTTHIDGNINYAPGYYTVGANGPADQMFDGYLADLWFNTDYIDLSQIENRRRFLDNNGNAKYLGDNGELVNGTAPDIFLSGDTANWHTNKGTNGGFTENGALTDAPTSPDGEKLPRYCANPTEGEGTMIFNSDEYVMQYCDGNSWIPLGPPGDGGSYCNPPFAYAGSLIFNTTYKTMQYCEGSEWVGIGKDTREDVLAAGLAGHWKLDETSGTVANDSSGNGFHGNYINTPVPATGIVSGALDFQEADRDGVEITGTNFGRPLSFTISGWVDVDSLDTNGGTLFNALQRGRVEIFPTYIEGSYQSAGSVQNRTQYTTNIIGTGWRHITYTMDYDSNWQRLYLDGVSVANSFFSDPVDWGGSTTSRIGRHVNDGQDYDIDGRLDDVKFYNRALSFSEVQEMYSASLADLPSSDWKFVSSGRYYTCGIKTDDTGHCWGYNYQGQLGNNSTSQIAKPTEISGGYTWNYLSAGATHSCGIISNGDGYCWGQETDGSLGNGTPDTNSLVPAPISGGHKWTVIEAAGNDDHTCGIADTQIGYCWGDGYGYTLGESGFTDRHTPNIIPDGYNWVDIDTGFWFGCGVTTEASNNGRCWGANSVGSNNGRLGYGGGNSRNWPNRVSGGHTWLQISNGDFSHGCGIIADGRAKCWGGNAYGQVGNGGNTDQLGTVFVSGGHTFTQVTTGYYHSCGMRTDGVTMCWGYNYYGSLGDGTTTNSNVPVVVSGGHTFTSISAGGYHTCGIRTDNKMYCWGRGTNGQLGTWKNQDSRIPVEVK